MSVRRAWQGRLIVGVSALRIDSTTTKGKTVTEWWKNAIGYHIYPRSFQDSDGDGFGDLGGILSRVDYLQDLGVNLIMLGPVYPSPDDDNGYDVADFRAIDPRYGTMDQWRELTSELHDRGMRIMMDIVLNHTSDEHRWFRQSRSAKDNPYRDYYCWRRGKENGTAPNNWQSVFSGSAWEADPMTDEYYLHLYSRRQPDLDWTNPQVRKEVADVFSFWVNEGVDAFRLDSITTVSKPDGLPDAPISGAGPFQPPSDLIFNGPKIIDYLREVRESMVSGRQILMVAEGPGVGVDEALDYLRAPENPVDMILQWEHIDHDPGSGGKWEPEWWTPGHFCETMTRWQQTLETTGWNALYFSNHDQPRQVSRFGQDGEYRAVSAKMLAMALYLLKGTPFIYQGEEIGMTNVDYQSADDFQDIESINYARELRTKGISEGRIINVLRRKSRDNGRTPMQWDFSPNGGFTSGTPWLKVNSNYSTINVSDQEPDPRSVLSFYKRLIQLRKRLDVISSGSYEPILAGDVFGYARVLAPSILYVIANFSGIEIPINLELFPGVEAGEVLLNSYDDGHSPETSLRPYEAVAVLLQ